MMTRSHYTDEQLLQFEIDDLEADIEWAREKGEEGYAKICEDKIKALKSKQENP